MPVIIAVVTLVVATLTAITVTAIFVPDSLAIIGTITTVVTPVILGLMALQVQFLNGKVVEVKGDVAVVKDEVTTVKSEVTGVKENVGDFKKQVDGQMTKLLELTATSAHAEGKLEGIVETVATAAVGSGTPGKVGTVADAAEIVGPVSKAQELAPEAPLANDAPTQALKE